MNPRHILGQFVSLNDLIATDSENIENLEAKLLQAKEEQTLLFRRRQRLVFTLAAWAIHEGVAGPDDDLHVDDPNSFLVAICDLIENHERLWETNGVKH
jgi:hypothetical protein